MKLVTAAQMREMDRQTIEEYGVPGIVLMENAALRVVEVIERRFAPLAGKRIAVVCGKGNNGGDGLAIARHLATRFGAVVTVWLAADPARLSGDAAANYKMARAFDLDLRTADSASGSPLLGGAPADIIIDALFGTGIKGGVTGPAAEVIDAVNAEHCPVVSVDVPSGLDADTGKVPGACVRATLTVTFALPKYGLLDFPGAEYVGELVVADIGMPLAVMEAKRVTAYATDDADIRRWLPPRTENRDSNKGRYGHVTLFAGSRGFIGAAVLSAEAAARSGAGLVTLAVPEGAQEIVVTRVSPVVMSRGLPQTEAGTFRAQAVDAALAAAGKGTVAALGPGIGGVEDPETQVFVREFVSRCPTPLVIDADALNILSQEPDRGAAIVKKRPAPTILTPHPGEMGRLLGKKTADIQVDRRGAVEQAARTYGCVALLKGTRTLIASPDGVLHLNRLGNAGMATGGAGDVLTGVVAALLAQKVEAHEAAAAGAYVHALAGDLAAEADGGKAGLIATDIIDCLPRAIGRCQGE